MILCIDTYSKFKDHSQEVDLHLVIDLHLEIEVSQPQYKQRYSPVLQMVHQKSLKSL